MSKYLIETTELYRCDDENEAKAVIEEAKRTSTVVKYDCVYKERKSKGEVIDSWYRVKIVKAWDNEKEPMGGYSVSYGSDASPWNGPEVEDEE